jgi:hypothetical protein
VVPAFHFAEQALALHLFLERFQRLVDVVVADDDLNDVTLSQFSLAAFGGNPLVRVQFPKASGSTRTERPTLPLRVA